MRLHLYKVFFLDESITGENGCEWLGQKCVKIIRNIPSHLPMLQTYQHVHSNNNASEVEILRHCETFWDHVEDFMMNSHLEQLDCFPSHFRPFSPIIGSLKKNRVPDPRSHGRKDGRTEPLIEMCGRI